MPSPRAAARQVRDDDRGFTLIEMLTGITIGLFVTFAAYSAIDATNKFQHRTTMRIEALNRGRVAMEVITRAIRSQQCKDGERPMKWASATGMDFYASVAPRSTTANYKQPIERHRIEWKAKPTDKFETVGDGTLPPNTTGDITETVWRGTIAANGTTVFANTPSTINVIARDVQVAPDRRAPANANPKPTAPIFRYFKYASTTGSGRVDLTAPVLTNVAAVDAKYNPTGLPSAAATDLAGIVLVEISYQVTPRKTRVAPSKPVNFYNTVSVRIADPTNPAGSPQCL